MDKGIPEILLSDSGTKFTAAETQEFLTRWKVHHRLSSGHYRQSNSRAEGVVKSAKRLLRDNCTPTGHLNTDAYMLAIMSHHNTQDRDSSCPRRRWCTVGTSRMPSAPCQNLTSTAINECSWCGEKRGGSRSSQTVTGFTVNKRKRMPTPDSCSRCKSARKSSSKISTAITI